MNKKYLKIFQAYALLAMIFLLFGASASAVTVIENNVSSSASTGGNVSEGGEIKTGDAKASSKVETNVSGDKDEKDTKVKIKVEAEANGKKVEAKVNEEDFTGKIDIKKEIQEDGAVAGLEVSVQELNAENREATKEEPERKNVIEKITGGLSNIFENLWEGLSSIFS